jgi:hypothetical protein
VLKHPPFASTETSQSTYGIDCFPFLDTNQADDDKRLRGVILKVARKPLSKSDLACYRSSTFARCATDAIVGSSRILRFKNPPPFRHDLVS